jgi:hypothetical protein
MRGLVAGGVLVLLTAPAAAREPRRVGGTPGPAAVACADDSTCKAVVHQLETVRKNIGGLCGTPRLVAGARLLALGPAALPFLREAWDDRDDEVRGAALLAALSLGDGPAVTAWCSAHPRQDWPCVHLPGLEADMARGRAIIAAGGRWTRKHASLELDAQGRGVLVAGKARHEVVRVELVGARADLVLADGTRRGYLVGASGHLTAIVPDRGGTLRPVK